MEWASPVWATFISTLLVGTDMEQLLKTKNKLVTQLEHHKKNLKVSDEEKAKIVRSWERNISLIDDQIREQEQYDRLQREALEGASASTAPTPETTASRKRKGKPEGSEESGIETRAQECRRKKALKTPKQEYMEVRAKRPPLTESTPIDALLHKCEDLAFFLKDAIDASPFRTEEFKQSIEQAREYRSNIDQINKKRLEDVERRIRALEEENKLLKENKETEALKKRLADAERRTRVLEWENKSLKGTNKEQERKPTQTTIATNTESEPSELAQKVTRIEQAIQTLLKREQAAPPATVSYAQATKRETKPRNPKPREITVTKRPHRHVATIYPKEGETNLNSEETRDALLKSISITKDQSKLKSIRKIQKGGVLVETATRGDLDKLLESQTLEKAGFQTGVPAKKLPKLVFYNTPKDLTEEQLMTAIKKHSITEEESKGIKPLFKTKKMNNWVVETTPKIRDRLVNAGRLFVEWSSCPVRDYVVASRCFRCQAFGHVAKHCRASVDTCGHCAQEGHTFKVCPNKKEKPSCINCKRVNKPHEHSSRADECPAYKRAKENLVRKTNYGD